MPHHHLVQTRGPITATLHAPPAPTATAPDRPRPILFAVRWLGVAVLGSVLAATLVAGVGSRIAMRISGATGARCAGLATENGNRCGEFTIEGTMFLLIFGGIAFGVLGGTTFAVLRPFVRGLGAWAGLATGLFLLAVGGTLVLDPHNVDFTRFGTPVGNVLAFSSLFLLYGLLVVPVVAWLDRRLPSWPPPRPLRVGTAVAVVVTALAALPGVFALVIGGLPIHPIAGGVVLIGALAVLAMLDRRRDGRPLAERTQRRIVVVGRVVLVVVAAVGAVPTTRAILEILAS